MDSIDPRVTAKAKVVRDGEITIINIVRSIENRLDIDENTALGRLIEVVVSNPKMVFYDRVATLGPLPHIRDQEISNGAMQTRLRLTVCSGWDAVEERFPRDTCRFAEVRVSKDTIFSALNNLLPKWEDEIRWIPQLRRRVGRPKDKEQEKILNREIEYTNKHYPSEQKNHIPFNKFVRSKDFITSVFPEKKFLKIKPKDDPAYTAYYGINPERFSLFAKRP